MLQRLLCVSVITRSLPLLHLLLFRTLTKGAGGNNVLILLLLLLLLAGASCEADVYKRGLVSDEMIASSVGNNVKAWVLSVWMAP